MVRTENTMGKAIIVTLFLNAGGQNVTPPTLHYVDSMAACQQLADSIETHGKVAAAARSQVPAIAKVLIFCKPAGVNDK